MNAGSLRQAFDRQIAAIDLSECFHQHEPQTRALLFKLFTIKLPVRGNLARAVRRHAPALIGNG